MNSIFLWRSTDGKPTDFSCVVRQHADTAQVTLNAIDMIRLFSIILSFLVFCNAFGQKDDSVRVTYIANSGYFIEIGSNNILIDAVFSDCIGKYGCPDSSLIERMINSKQPFEHIDFVLITHNHPDHVKDSLVVEMLQKRNDFEILMPQQVYSSIARRTDLSQFASRIHKVQLDTAEVTHLEINEVVFDIARSKHADTYDIENLCYIINDVGFRILHTGDSWPESIVDIDSQYFNNIDLAIIPISFGKDRFAAHDSILSPRYTLISHVKKDFVDKFKEIIKIDTMTFGTKDVLFESFESVIYKR